MPIDSISSDASDPRPMAADCYCRGTLIRTARGEVPIEELVIGDKVFTATAASRPVRWLGSRTIETARAPDPLAVSPVCIRAGALGEHIPVRDLWVSPGHGLYLGEALIPAEQLVNAATIVRVARERVEYWHVELDRHAVIYAEGLPAESFLDGGHRRAFANGSESLDGFPDSEPMQRKNTVAPVVTEGAALHRAKAAILERALALGFAITPENDPHIVADGERIEAMRLSPSRFAFALPVGRDTIELRCTSFVPAYIAAASEDTRELGICVGRWQLDGTDVALNDAGSLTDGWHDLEVADGRMQRWTRARVPLPAGTRVLIVDVASPSHCWAAPSPRPPAMERVEVAVEPLTKSRRMKESRPRIAGG